MALKIRGFFIFIFIGSLIMVYLFQPTKRDKKQIREMPILEFGNFQAFEIGEYGVNRIVIAKEAFHYSKKDILLDTSIVDRDSVGFKSIWAKKVVFVDNEILFPSKTTYSGSDGVEIFAEDIVYDITKKIASSKGIFNIVSDTYTVSGTELLFDLKNEKIEGNKISGKFEFGKK